MKKPSTRPARGLKLLVLAGSFLAGDLPALERPPFLEDPLNTRKAVSPSRARSAYRPGVGEPCPAEARIDRTWTLVDIIDQALCHNPQTRQTWASARAQAAQLGVAQAAYLPTINFNTSLSYGQTGTRSASQSQLQDFTLGTGIGGGSFGRQEQFRITPSVSLNYLLFDFGGRSARVDSARAALEAANWSHAATLQNVLFNAVQAYYQLFAARSALEATQASERSSEEAFKAASFRYEVGAAALADKLQAQTAYAQAKLNRQRAEGEAQNALGVLANVMGLKPDPSLNIASPAYIEPDEERERDVQALIEEAKALRPDLAAAEAQVRAAEANVRSARSNSLPTLSLVSNYSYSDSSVSQNFQSWSVGLQLSVPLFTGFANTYQIRNAEEQVAVQEATRDQLDQAIALDVWRAYFDLNTTRETLASTRDLLASATQSEKVALGRYKAGAGSILELLNAEADLANARLQYVQARYNWHIGKARLAQAIGALDPTEIGASLRTVGKKTNLP
ncbi:TolC family protein [Methylocaldum szegediense]|uniref:Protein CyaE n=1 Tax=Methylocaldum szegediense TaxID=73780 RepID=A0ABM9I4Y8_9GAMM|nr:TolC family protein [Methylocaldum szegediense]CAI8896313.1 Protein CyaE [Methylocaldum szegediense]